MRKKAAFILALTIAFSVCSAPSAYAEENRTDMSVSEGQPHDDKVTENSENIENKQDDNTTDDSADSGIADNETANAPDDTENRPDDPDNKDQDTPEEPEPDEITLFIERLYNIILGRASNESGMEHWTGLCKNKDITITQMVHDFVFSEEYLGKNTSDEEYVNMLFDLVMDGKTDEDLKDKFLFYLEAGVSRMYVYSYFAHTDEFAAMCEGIDVEKGDISVTNDRDRQPEITVYVQILYRGCLGRSAAADELDLKVGSVIRDGKTAADIAYSIIFSDECKEKEYSDEEYAEILYRGLLNRGSDEDGFREWTAKLGAGYTREAVLRGFVVSDEFTKRCEGIGIERGIIDVGGWINHENGLKQYVSPETGNMVYGYVLVNGIHCYFDEFGYLRTDWSDLKNIVNTSKQIYSYDEMVDDIIDMQQQYPMLVRLASTGVTADDRQIFEMIIGNKDAKKQLVIHAGCHAREYMGSMLLMNQAEYMLRNYWDGEYNGRSYRELLDEYQIHIIPMLNPDGISISQFGLEGLRRSSLRSKVTNIYKNECRNGTTDKSFDAYLRSWKANAYGADINSNFDVNRNAPVKMNRPCSANYRGYYGESEYETQAVTRLVRSLDNIQAVISYHSSGSMIYWAYGQTGDFRNKCADMANGLRSTTGYFLISGDDYGMGCSNWVASLGIRAATIEIGTGDSPLPLNQYPAIWNANRNVIPYLLSSL